MLTMNTGLSSAFAGAWDTVRSLGGWTSPANRLMRHAPRPLIHPDARMIVIFSPKSACTSVVIWFLHQLGEAERAQAYHRWPHRYRGDVYYRSDLYRQACNLDLTGFRVVRVVRDPFDRAVSSFRHVQRSGIADTDFKTLLARSDAAEAGVSFREFLDLLERMDLTRSNEHFGIQRHPVEDKLPVTHLINISTEDLFTRLNQVEADLGLPITNFAELHWIHSLAERRSRFNGRIATNDAYELRLTRSQARRGPWPPYSALLTPPARERIAHLYAADIAAYGQAPVRDAPQVTDRRVDPRAIRRERRERRQQRRQR